MYYIFHSRLSAYFMYVSYVCLDDRSSLHKIFCVGGDPIMDTGTTTDLDLREQEERLTVPQLSVFLGSSYAELLLQTPTKITVLVLYVAYLGCSIWGCVTLEEGLQLQNLAPDDSYLVPFYESYDPYFSSQWGPRTMVALTKTLDYSNSEISQQVHDTVKAFQTNQYFVDQNELTSSWLRDFEIYLDLSGQSVHNMSQFINILVHDFLTIPQFEQYILDIKFSDHNTEIVASRFLVQAKGIESPIQEKELVLDAREIASEQPISTTVYHAAFIFYDQYVVIVSNTIRNLSMAAACMLLVAILLLPHPLAVVWVTVSVLSICTGVVGFMTFWDVNLDSISMINLIMCIGFSVDFSGHICYHYTVSDETSPANRMKQALQHLGLPILQGGVSTILGVCVLAFSNSYIFRTFFKLVFLVMIFGLLHAMIFLPVILTIIGPGSCKRYSSTAELGVSPIEMNGQNNHGVEYAMSKSTSPQSIN